MVCTALASGVSRACQSHSTMADTCRAMVRCWRTEPTTVGRQGVGHLFENGRPQAVGVTELVLNRPPGDSGRFGDSVCAHGVGRTRGEAEHGRVEYRLSILPAAAVQPRTLPRSALPVKSSKDS